LCWTRLLITGGGAGELPAPLVKANLIEKIRMPLCTETGEPFKAHGEVQGQIALTVNLLMGWQGGKFWKDLEEGAGDPVEKDRKLETGLSKSNGGLGKGSLGSQIGEQFCRIN